MKILLLIYVVLMPFMSALAPSDWMPLPLLFMIMVSPILVLNRSGPPLSKYIFRDIGFVVMLSLGIFAMLLTPIPLGSKNFNYSIALVVCFLYFFVFVRLLLTKNQIYFRHVITASHFSLTFLSLSIISEFYFASFHNIYISDIIPFAHRDLNIATMVNETFKRPRAFSVEPGFTALAFECLWPIALSDFGKKHRGVLRHVLYAVAFLLLASAAAMVCLIVASFLVWVIHFRNWRDFIKIVGLFTLLIFPLLIESNGQDLLWSVIGRKLDIVSLDVTEGSDGVTALVRLLTYETGIRFVEAFPGGIGWGGIGQAFSDGLSLPINASLMGSGMLSLYLDIAVASGVLGLFAFVYFVGIRLVGLLSSVERPSIYVSCALLSVSFHHVFITEFQYPFIWFLLALADKIILDRKSMK